MQCPGGTQKRGIGSEKHGLSTEKHGIQTVRKHHIRDPGWEAVMILRGSFGSNLRVKML